MEDYSKKDFPSNYEDILSMVKSGTNLWNPSNSTEADPGVVVLKIMAFLEDKAGYRFDMAHAQNYLDSVSDRQSAQDLLRMLGYVMRHARAATGEVRMQKITTSSTNITVPIFTLLTDRTKSIKFFTTDTVSVTNSITVVPVQAGEPFQIVKDGVAYFTLKDVDEQGRLYLGKTGLAQNGIYVFSDRTIEDASVAERASHRWTYIDFSILKPSGNFYTVGEGDNGEMYVQFPDNFEDLLTDQHIEVWAIYTEGAASNITANTLALLDESAVFTGSTNLVISQTTDIYTGQDEETIDEAVKHYYETRDVCNTLVTAQDFTSAIRYLVNGDSDSIDGTLPGQRFFSNAVVKTAQSRRLPVRTRVYDKEYTLFEDAAEYEPCNQIDVVGLQYASSYSDSFKIRPIASDIEGEFETQLQDNHSLDADIVDARDTDDKGDKIDRILAVTTPSMTLRVSRNASITDVALKQKIRDYFYSKYRADNLVFGKALDYQTIVDDIRALDPSINSVALEELSYKLYHRFNQVDGTSVELTEKTKTSAIAESVLAGIVPLYKFANRQNTPSKQNVLYSTSHQDEEEESVYAVPFNSSSFDKVDNGNPTSLTVQNAIFCDGQDVSTEGIPLISRNQLLQFRRAKMNDETSFGYGMQYVFTRYKILDKDVTVGTGEETSYIGDGTVLTRGSHLEVDGALPNDTSSGTPPFDGSNTVQVASVIMQGRIAVKSGTKLAEGTKLAPGSTITVSGTEKIEFNPDPVPQDSSYMLQEGESLRVTTSTGEEKGNYGAGKFIKTTGFTLVMQPDTKTLTSLGTTQSIAAQAQETSDITPEFRYILSLKRKQANDKVDIANGYMLEEGEFFIYADKAITEYVILGPGTVLKSKSSSGDTELSVSYMSSVDEVTKESGFKDVPFSLSGQVYEFQNFRYPAVVAFSSGFSAGSSITVRPTWTKLSGTCSIYTNEKLYPSNLTDVQLQQKIMHDDGKASYTLEGFRSRIMANSDGRVKTDLTASEGWEYRTVFLLETDEDNVCMITRPAKIRVGNMQDLIPQTGTDVAFISASSSFSSVITSSTQTVLPEGVQLRFSYGTTKTFNSVETDVSYEYETANRILLGYSSNSSTKTPCSINLPHVVSAETVQIAVYVDGTPSSSTSFSFSSGKFLKGNSNTFSPSDPKQKGGDILSLQVASNTTLKISVTSPSKCNLVLTDMSYITSKPAKESGATDVSAIESAIKTMYEGGRFNWLYTPTEDFSDPTNPLSFFNKMHPYNYCTIPYINFDPAKIVIIRER